VKQGHTGRHFELRPPRHPTGAGAEGQHPTVGRSKARMGVCLLIRAMLQPDGCGSHHLRFCGNGLDCFAKEPEAAVRTENYLARDWTALPKRLQSGPKITWLGNFPGRSWLQPLWQSSPICSHKSTHWNNLWAAIHRNTMHDSVNSWCSFDSSNISPTITTCTLLIYENLCTFTNTRAHRHTYTHTVNPEIHQTQNVRENNSR